MKNRKARILGPGTIVAVAVAMVAVALGALKPNTPSFNSLDVIRERIGREPASAPLWKPEPVLILSKLAELDLTRTQVLKLRSIDVSWQRDKADLTREAESQFKIVRDSKAKLSELVEFSAISRVLDTTRDAYWRAAIGCLTPNQRIRFESLRVKRGQK